MGFSHTQVATNGIKFTDLEFAHQCKEAGLHTLYLQFDGVCDDVRSEERRVVFRSMGFPPPQVATNGIKFTDLEFAHQCKEAGLHTLYLQFDGVCDDIYRRTRGERLWEQKLQCIENVKKAGLKIVFVPTIVKGLNDNQIGDIVRIALEYIECTSGISFQPVAFTGRIAKHELEEKRFTLSDFAHAIQRQTGIADAYEDWFPLSCVTPFSKLLSALRGEETTTLSCHPHCSLGTYLFVDQNRKAVPVTQFVEIGPMLQ